VSSNHNLRDQLEAPAPGEGPRLMAGELRASLQAGAELTANGELEVKLNGVFVPTDRVLPVGTVVALKLRLSDNGPALTTMARVVYTVSPEHAALTHGEAGMRLELVEVWGERLAVQLASFLREAEKSTSPPAVRAATPLVLVVDDDAHYRELCVRLMRESGFEVLAATNGLQALSIALRHQPSLVITDVNMPNMDGWQFLRMVRARPELKRTPIVFLTTQTSDEERLRGYQLGVDDYVAKPFTDVELIARVERVLERAHAAEEAVANGIRGDLSKVPLASVLMLAEHERRSGVVQLMRAGESATLHLRDGMVVRIDLAEPHDLLEGIARFFYVLDWEEGRFELNTSIAPSGNQLDLRTSHVLLEHARTEDEAARGS
jgi:DNA-binding response OmpR family regulator/Tfp pilus assembly protein PilZ